MVRVDVLERLLELDGDLLARLYGREIDARARSLVYDPLSEKPRRRGCPDILNVRYISDRLAIGRPLLSVRGARLLHDANTVLLNIGAFAIVAVVLREPLNVGYREV